MEIINNIKKKKKNNNLEEKYKKIVKKILNMSQENILKKDNYYTFKHKTRNKSKTISYSNIFENKSLFVSKSGKNITKNNYINKLNREKPLIQESISMISTAHSGKNAKIHDMRKIFGLNQSKEKVSKKDKKSGEMSGNKIIFNKIKNLHFSSNLPPSTTQSFIRKHDISFIKKSNANYVNNRVKYIIKNTRLLFTKTKNLDKIVRMKRSNSTL